MITGFTMTITPDELKQIVSKAVLETMTLKNDAPTEVKFYTRHEICEKRSYNLFSCWKACFI